MIVKEYLEALGKNEDVTFIIARAVKDDDSIFYHTEYYQTPIRVVYEWLKADSILNKLVINKDHAPIDITGSWTNWYNKGHLKCCVIADDNYLNTRYSSYQAEKMEAYYKNIIK